MHCMKPFCPGLGAFDVSNLIYNFDIVPPLAGKSMYFEKYLDPIQYIRFRYTRWFPFVIYFESLAVASKCIFTRYFL